MTARPAPTQYGDRAVYPVSEFNRGVAGWLERLPRVWVEGEVSELKRNDRWALAYLTLKDLSDGSLLPAFIGRTRLDAISPPIQEGERVHVHGRGQIYRARGTFSFEVTALERFGLGQLLRAIEELRTRLAADGLFDQTRKRPLPFLPGTIGLICGSDAAAKRDVVETAAERYPPARFRIREVAVQGTAAVGQIVAAVKLLDRDPAIDVIVLARGGGSFEDLLPFSDERVVRAVADAATPVVSAIGHEQDVPLVDLAADVRAGTPSLAAKLVVPDHAAEAAALDSLLYRGATGLANGAGRARERLTDAGRAAGLRRPDDVDRHAAAYAGAAARLSRPLPGCANRAGADAPDGGARPVAAARPGGDTGTRLRGGARRGGPRGARLGGHGGRAADRRAAVPRPAGRARRGGERMSDEELTFEQARDELEETVRRLESGQTSLDEALRLWERGEALYELCQARLDQAEERIAAALERLRQRRPPETG